ncbi:MAG: hypothetical protein HC772_17025 [Leptolyngbyaceae cyanobacterium CRU_2_3]|nr:hypothetical protein [Leptolyngbyaceae cyanobacterium CRU_2_3]
MASTLQFKLNEISAQHQATIAASLARRLAVAQADQNMQLIALLEQEQEQLSLDSRQSGFAAFSAQIKQIWHSWMEAIVQSSELSVDQIMGDDGTLFWRAHDPQTGKTLYAESRSDVVKWIEDNDLGR